MAQPAPSCFEETLQSARVQLWAGDAATALSLLEGFAIGAWRRGQRTLAERAQASAACVRLEIPGTKIDLVVLRRMLGASDDSITRYLAARAISGHYLKLGMARHATFYARIALAVAPANRADYAHHGLGVSLLCGSVLGDAISHLRAGCELWSAGQAPPELGWSTLAYALALAGDCRAARAVLRVASRRETQFPVYNDDIQLNLGYTWLELGEAEEARHHATRALAAILRVPSHEHKAALYLLGESAAQLGDEDEAVESFNTLCRTYYPGLHCAAMLFVLRTAPLVNWLA